MQSSIRKQLLDALAKAEGGYISGQEIATLTGASRTAVWKHIEEMRRDGYTIEAVRRKGYKLLSSPDILSADSIRLQLASKVIGQRLYYFDSVDSTQKKANVLAGEGAPEGTAVVADEQVSGRGRLRRSWHSPKGTGIWMSLIIRPDIPLFLAPQMTLLTAVAVSLAIQEVTELKPAIKWPNDILIDGKKVTGILTEMKAEADKIHHIIIGIGINVNQKANDFPADLQEKAASLSMLSGQEISREKLIASLFSQFEKIYTIYRENGFGPIKTLWESFAISLGRTITAVTSRETIIGKALGITDEGVLLLEDAEGTVHSIYSADIHI